MRDAATVMLVRDGMLGLEVFMVRRHIRSDFVGGAYVFPGGTLEPADGIPESFCAGRSDAEASRDLGVASGGLAFWVAGLRESFEESGILLAYEESGEFPRLSDPEISRKYAAYRAALQDRRIAFVTLLRDEKLRLATDRVHYWSHWITPEGQPRRYDTRFFLAIAPSDQVADHDGRELTDSTWIAPQSALAKAESREWSIILPTRRNLQRLGEFPTAGAAEIAARKNRDVPAVLPRVVDLPEGKRILVPGESVLEPLPEELQSKAGGELPVSNEDTGKKP